MATSAIGQELYSSSASAFHAIGEYFQDAQGRGYRYTKAGGTALVVGRLQQASAEDTTNLQDLTCATNSVGDMSITTTSSVTLSANQAAGGFITVVSATTGSGQVYRIRKHAAASAAVVTFHLEEPIRVATTGTVKVDVIPNPYNGVVIMPTTPTSGAVGVAIHAIAASEYGWIQTKGVCSVLADGANAVGAALVPSNGTAGAVEDAASPGAQGGQIGYALTGVADTDCGLVNLTID